MFKGRIVVDVDSDAVLFTVEWGGYLFIVFMRDEDNGQYYIEMSDGDGSWQLEPQGSIEGVFVEITQSIENLN